MGELFSKRDLRIIRKREMLYGDFKRSSAEWRALLDEWHWWSSNWRKFPGYFLGKVAVLGFDEFLSNYKIAKEGRPIYERMRFVSRARMRECKTEGDEPE